MRGGQNNKDYMNVHSIDRYDQAELVVQIDEGNEGDRGSAEKGGSGYFDHEKSTVAVMLRNILALGELKK